MMRRAAMKPSTVALKRSGFLRAHRREAIAVIKLGKRIKSKGPRMTPIRRAARGQDCTLQFAGICNRNAETTVLCHSNSLIDGKGMGLKAPDECAAFGCSACHDLLDGRRPRPEELSLLDIEMVFARAVKLTHQILARMGLLQQVNLGE